MDFTVAISTCKVYSDRQVLLVFCFSALAVDFGLFI